LKQFVLRTVQRQFKPKSKSLEIVDEISSEVYRILVEDNKKMSFVPIPAELNKQNRQQVSKSTAADEKQDELPDDEDDDSIRLPEILEEKYGEDRHFDTKLQTKLPANTLDKKLLKISNEARTYAQETGIDIMYLVLGFLVWYENDNSSLERKAPLILIPVELTRKDASERFKVRYTQADLSVNLTLEAKMMQDFSIQLPKIDDDLDVQKYFQKTHEAAAHMPRWEIHENEIALGFFSFGKFRIYQDLNPDVWPEERKPFRHPMIKKLLTHGIEDYNSFPMNNEKTESQTAKLPDFTEVHFVKDADSSQTEAIKAAVIDGKNLVIQGPPGTGKSQTITNILSESLARNKKVLFVAEKMAALEVVKKRLDECNLGAAVLELHSHKSNKKEVLKELQRTLELGLPEIKDHTIEKYRYLELQQKLNNYYEKVNQPILNSGYSYIDALGKYLRIKRKTAGYQLPKINFEPYRNWTKRQFVAACSSIINLVDQLKITSTPQNHIFGLSGLQDFSPARENVVKEKIIHVIESFSKLKQEINDICEKIYLDPQEYLYIIETIIYLTENHGGYTSIERIEC